MVSLTRRAALAGALAPLALAATPAAFADGTVGARLAAIEASVGGRLGVCVFDLESGRRFGHRENERFPLCSTFKLVAAAFVLARADRGAERLDRRVTFAAADLVPYSPVTEKHVGAAGMTLDGLCAAAVTLSDNTAGNLLLASFGGPAALTGFLRELGDPVTRLDRIEPHLNEAAPGDPRDTTTPAAMVDTMKRLLVDDALSPPARRQLIAWLVGSKTGGARLRAGLPPGWPVGDKTGSGDHGATNDVAIVMPPGRKPVLIAAYLAETPAAPRARDVALAEVGRLVAAAMPR